MSGAQEDPSKTEKKIQDTIKGAEEQLDLAKEKLSASTGGAGKEAIRNTINELQEALDYLRLSVKYLTFDLEATRRENAHLRKLLEQKADGDSSPNDDIDLE